MGSRSRWMGHAFGVALVGIVCTNGSPPAWAQSKVRSFRLAAHSPLASDGRVLFAVADDGRTLLVGSSVGGNWRQVEGWSRKVAISGLAAARDALYVSSAPAGAIYRLDLGKGGEVEGAPAVFHRGAPLQRPAELAWIADGGVGSLLVADEGAGTVFRVPLRTGDKRITEALRGLPSPLRGIHLATDRWDLVVTSADRSEIYQPAPFENTAAIQREGNSVSATVWKTREPVARHHPTLERPASAALAHGSLYVIDDATGAVYVSPRQQTRPVRVTPPTATAHATRLLALGDTLMVLDGKRGVLEPWPLPVFTEFNLGARPRDAITGLYAFLAKRGALPTRSVRRQGSVRETLAQEGVGFGAPSNELVELVCSLVPGQCQAAPAPTETLVVPDLPSETAAELGTFRLRDLGESRTLGEGLAQSLSDVQANPTRVADDIWKLNYDLFETLNLKSGQARRSLEKRQYGPYAAATLLSLRQEDFPPGTELTVRYEKVRTLAALPRALLHDESELPRLRLLSSGFNWVPLQEAAAKEYGSALLRQPTAAPPFDVTVVQRAHADLMKTVHGTLPPAVVAALSLKTHVGVIEDERFGIDVAHVDFDPAAFTLLSPSAAVAAAAAGPSPSPTPTPAPAFRICGAFDQECLKANHGTAVAGLIASRGLFSHAPGLAPSAVIVPLRSEDTVAGADVTKAFSDHRVRIFNLSAHYDQKLTRAIRRAITQNDKALFVVAAGNNATNGEPICESETPYPAYPVCEGYRRNVLVVAATDLAGNALIAEGPDAPGSNWNDRLVHVAAPGEGFYATGRGNSYMAVRGTSFATPLVTATAALLYAQRVLSPWSIKQRIIATADVKNNLRQKVVGAGLLNVERAVTSPWKSVLTPRSGAATKVELDLAADEIEIRWDARGGKSGGTRKLRLQDVLRLTQMPGGNANYRIVYYDDVTETLVIQENVQPGPWPFRSDQGVRGVLEDYVDYVGPVVDR